MQTVPAVAEGVGCRAGAAAFSRLALAQAQKGIQGIQGMDPDPNVGPMKPDGFTAGLLLRASKDQPELGL